MLSLRRDGFLLANLFSKPNSSAFRVPSLLGEGFVKKFLMFSSSSSKENFHALVTTSWLDSQLLSNKQNLKILDGSWVLRPEGKSMRERCQDERIPFSEFFDIDQIADHSTNLPHMLPTPMVFQNEVRALGINKDDHVIVYDRSNQYIASARVWWTFQVFGHEKVSVLDGGFLKWKSENRKVETGSNEKAIKRGDFVASYRSELVQTLDQMRENVKQKRQIVDARPAGRFKGDDPEPRPGLRSGHIPGSKNVPSICVLTVPEASSCDNRESALSLASSGIALSFRTDKSLANVFQEAGIEPLRPVTCTCGSGVTASVLALGLHLLGNRQVSVYDGSWSEWGSYPEELCPAIKGPS